LHQRIAPWPDQRPKGPNTRYALQEAAWGALGLFCTQSPSFLAYQRRRQHTQGHKTVQPLWGGEQMPCDQQSRTLLDPLAPPYLEAVFGEVCEALEQPRLLAPLRGRGAQRLVPSMGPTTFRPQLCIAPTVSPVNGPMASPSPILPLAPPCSSALARRKALPYPQRTACRKTGIPNRTVKAPRANAGFAPLPPQWPPMA